MIITTKIAKERYAEQNLDLLEEYVNSYTKLKTMCKTCEYCWYPIPNNVFQKRSRCPRCTGHAELTNNIIDEDLVGRNIKRLDDVINSSTKIRWQCLIDGNIWKAKPNDIRNGNGCSKCSNNSRVTNETVDEKLLKEKRQIRRVDNVISSRKNIKWECLECGNLWLATPGNLVNNRTGCPNCTRNNKNEFICKEVLEELFSDVTHQHEIKFNNIKHKVDFFIKEINTIIEYNGIQHYEPVKFFGGEEKFKKQLIIDESVRKYCKLNGIKLIEIDGRVFRIKTKQKLIKYFKEIFNG